MKRQRATIIVEVDQRILLVENRGGLVLLPGGGINPEESRLQAAVRSQILTTPGSAVEKLRTLVAG